VEYEHLQIAEIIIKRGSNCMKSTRWFFPLPLSSAFFLLVFLLIFADNAFAVEKNDIEVIVMDNASAGVKGGTVYLKKQVTGGFDEIKTGYTDASGMKTFRVSSGKTYKVVVYYSGVQGTGTFGRPFDFDGSVAGKQKTVESGLFTLNANQVVSFHQGISATDGPVGKEWRGTNGTAPIIIP
jgi:hypothetical protein